MSDPAGEPANGLNLLGLAQMLLTLVQSVLGELAIADVLHRQEDHPKMLDAAAAGSQVFVPHAREVALEFDAWESDPAMAQNVEFRAQRRDLPGSPGERINRLAFGS